MGLGLGVLDSRLFTAMVIMALVTTLMTGPLLDLIHSRAEPEPLDRREARAAGRSGG